MTLPIITKRLILRRFTYDDSPDILELVSHPSVARITTNIEASESKVREYIDKQNSIPPFEKNRWFDLGIEKKDDGKVIGLLSFVCEDHQQGAIGWSLGIDHRGKGYVTEGARALISYAFTALALHRIRATTSSINPASWKVMERIGMRKEAHFHEVELRDGEWIDVLVYGILAKEWATEEDVQRNSL